MNHSRRHWLTSMSLGSVAMLGASPASARVPARAPDPMLCTPVADAVPDVGPTRKFAEDGRIQRYPGNTVICHIPRPSKAFDELTRAWAELRARTGEHHVTWLPPSSYHMTVFDGVTHAFRRPGDWPHGLPLDASMDECNRFVAEKLRNFDLGTHAPFRMVVDDSPAHKSRFSIRLRGIDAAETKRLYELRDRISEAIGVRHANHATYEFHTTAGYYVRKFSPADELTYQANFQRMLERLRKNLPVIELNAPEYTLFDDMSEFRTQFVLSRKGAVQAG